MISFLEYMDFFKYFRFLESRTIEVLFAFGFSGGAGSGNYIIDKVLPSLIGTGSALLIFYLTTKRDRNKEQKDKLEEREDKITYLKSLVDNIIVVTTQQRDHLSKHVRKIRENNVDFQLMTFVPLTDFNRAIEILNKEEYYLSYSKYFKEKIDTAKTFNALQANIEYLDAQFFEIKEILRKSQQFDHERKEHFKELIDKSMSITGDILLQNKDDMPQIFKDIDEILLNFLTGLQDNSDISYYYNEFAIKMNGLLVDHILTPGTKVSNEIRALSENIRNAIQLFEFIKKSNSAVATDIDDIRNQVEGSLTKITDIRGEMNQ